MAQVEAFQVAGLDMQIRCGDHDPPHFHASRQGEWAVRVYILEREEGLIQLEGPLDAVVRGRDRRALIVGVRGHRAELLAEWEACHGRRQG